MRLMAPLFFLISLGSGGASDSSRALPLFERGLDLFDQARAYASEHPTEREEASRRYRSAADNFVAAWRAGAASSEVFTNAANSFFFAGAIGEAVLFYKRALAVDPSNTRAKEALEHLRSTLPIRKPPSGAGASILRSLFFWHERLPFEARRTAFLASFPAAFLFFAIALWRKRPLQAIGFVFLVPALFLLGSLFVDALGGSVRSDGVIMVEVEGRKGDGAIYSPSYSRPFPPGTEVAIQSLRSRKAEDSQDAWLLVRLLDGKESWVPEGTVEKVIP